MGRKRPGGVVDLSCSGDSETGGSEDIQCSQLPYMDMIPMNLLLILSLLEK